MFNFYAFQWATDEGEGIFISQNEAEVNAIAETIMPTADTHAIGTVSADDKEDATLKIMAGKWEYSQKV